MCLLAVAWRSFGMPGFVAGRLVYFSIIMGDYSSCGKVCACLHDIGFIGLPLLLGLMLVLLLRSTTLARSRPEDALSSKHVPMYRYPLLRVVVVVSHSCLFLWGGGEAGAGGHQHVQCVSWCLC